MPGEVPRFEPIPGGLRIKTVGAHHVDVLSMAYTDRIVTTPTACPDGYDRYWCYPKGGAAVFAALVWDGADDTDPVGWLKDHHGRRATLGPNW